LVQERRSEGTSLLAGIASAVICLHSRTYTAHALAKEYRKSDLDPARPETYGPQTMWFFQMIAGMDDRAFVSRVGEIEDRTFQSQALSWNVVRLAERVVEKHRWVNRGFVSTALALVFFLCMLVSYLVRLA
jgi:hypothetical protein